MEPTIPSDESIDALVSDVKSNKRKPALILIASILIILLATSLYLYVSKTEGTWPFRVKGVTNLDETSIGLDTLAQEKVYIQTWSDSQINPELEFYEVSAEKVNKIFTQDSKEFRSVLGIVAGKILVTEVVDKVSELPARLSIYDTQTQESENLVSLDLNHALEGVLSLDKTKVVFADYCQRGCGGDGDEAVNVIKSIDLQTRKISTHFKESAVTAQFFGVPRGWVDEETVVLIPMGPGEGPVYYRKVSTLNIKTNKREEFELDLNARYVSVDPKGSRLIFTTFAYDPVKKEHVSMLAGKTFAGDTQVFKNSDNLEYEEARWIDEENLVILAREIVSVNEDCAYDVCREGNRSIYVFNTKTGSERKVNVSAEPKDLFAVLGNDIYYVSNVATPITYLKSTNNLHLYSLDTGEDKIIFQSPRYINSIPRDF